MLRRSLITLAQSVRGFCSVLGMTLLLVLAIEGGFRLKQQVSGELHHDPPVPDSYANSDWFRGFNQDYNDARVLRWKPFLYFGRKPLVQSRTVNTDGLGRRATPQPSTPSAPLARVFFFGGSTMWGTAQRDSHTIAAVTSKRLQALAGPTARIEVTNLGENGYVSTQQLFSLILELREGHRPDVVVFLDGINDVFSTLQMSEGGIPQNESKRAAEFKLGRQLDRTGFARGFRKDLTSVGILLLSTIKQLALVDWVLGFAPTSAPNLLPTDAAVRATVGAYSENVRIVEALGARYGFTGIYIWQPTIHSTAKPLTSFEQGLMRSISNDPTQHRMKEVHLAIPAVLDTLIPAIAPGRFLNAVGLFRNDSSDVYYDRVGHNTEASIPTIVDAFWPLLKSALVARHPQLGTTAPARSAPAVSRPVISDSPNP